MFGMIAAWKCAGDRYRCRKGHSVGDFLQGAEPGSSGRPRDETRDPSRLISRSFSGNGQGHKKPASDVLQGRQRGWCTDVLERLSTVGGGGGNPPWTPLPPFQCLRLTAKILLRRQEDLSSKFFDPPLAGTTGEPWEEGCPSQPPPPFRPQPGNAEGTTGGSDEGPGSASYGMAG